MYTFVSSKANLVGAILLITLGVIVLSPVAAGALVAPPTDSGPTTGSVSGVNCGGSQCDTGLPNTPAGSSQVQQLVQIVLAIFGAVAILIIVLAGLHFITSQGNPQEVAKARNTILYAAIGLIVVMLAEGLVAFVLGKVG